MSEEVALGDPGPAEIVGHVVDGAKVFPANAVVAVLILDGTIGGLAALHEVFAGGAEEDGQHGRHILLQVRERLNWGAGKVLMAPYGTLVFVLGNDEYVMQRNLTR
jgi:hypothetical protein